MTMYPTIVRGLNHEPTRHGTNALLLVLGVAACVLGVAMLSRGGLPSRAAAHPVPPTPITLGQGESLVAIAPAADRVSSRQVMSPARNSSTRGVATCPPRLATVCDLRLGLMEMALQQRGFSLGRPVALSEQVVPAKYCALARAEAAVARAAASPLSTPQAKEPGC